MLEKVSRTSGVSPLLTQSKTERETKREGDKRTEKVCVRERERSQHWCVYSGSISGLIIPEPPQSRAERSEHDRATARPGAKWIHLLSFAPVSTQAAARREVD